MPRCDWETFAKQSASNSSNRDCSTPTHGAEAHDGTHVPVSRSGREPSQPLRSEVLHASMNEDNPAPRSRYSLVGGDDRGTNHRFHDLGDLE